MKIVERNGAGPALSSEWMTRVNSLSETDLLLEMSKTKQWEWEDLDDLSSVVPFLEKIDSMLSQSLEASDYNKLDLLLDFSSVLISSASSKSLYDSLQKLLQILDLPNWSTVFKCLKLLKTLVTNNSGKLTKAHKNPELIHKLYILGLGSHLNSSNSISLQDLCSDVPLAPIPFQCLSPVSGLESLPDNLKYVFINRERTNQSLDSVRDRQLIVASQLLALSVFLQLYPEAALIQEFCRTLPEIWLLPAISELIRTPQAIEVHTSALSLLSSILHMLESSRHESFHSQLANVAHEIFAAWNGLILNLLRDIAVPSNLNIPSLGHSDFINAVLDLAIIIADSKHRIDNSHLPSMTCSLLCLLKNPLDGVKNYQPDTITKVVRILSMLLPHSMEMFKEVNGINTCIRLATDQIKELMIEAEGSFYDRVAEVKALLRLIKTALAKWDPVPGQSMSVIKEIIDNGLMTSISELFNKKVYEIYEEALVLVTQMINENQNLVSDLASDGTILSLLDSLENHIPCSPRFIEILAKFLCITALNIDGARIFESYNIIPKLILVLGDCDSTLFSNSTAVGIGESLQELIASVPNTIEKAIEGCIQLVESLKQADLSNTEAFFSKILNIGKLFTHTFNFTPDFIKGFVNRGGLDNLLEIFKLPVLPRYFNNEFYAVTACFKSLPPNLISHVLLKVMQALNQQLQRLQDVTGSFTSIKDFSQVSETAHTGFLHLLTEGDCYLEIIRAILQNWAGISSNYKDFCELLEKLAVLLRLLIAEQARLLCVSKLKEKTCEKFNIAVDMSVIESTEFKSYEENLYFCCQLTIRRVFRLAMKIPNNRGRQASNEEAGLAISRVIGEIFTQNIKVLNLDEVSPHKTYHLAMQLSDIMKILLYEQGSTPATVLTFANAGGTDYFSQFLIQLKQVSFEVSQQPELNYHVVNGLQILWNLSGKFLENLVMGKYLNSTYGQLVIKALGFDSPKEVVKKMQGIVLETLKKINFLECGVISTQFAKSVLEILKSLSNLSKESLAVDNKAVKAVVEMGFSSQVARQALAATGAASVEMAMEWIFSHPEVLDLPLEPEPPAPTMIDNLHQKLINALPCIPSLHSIISDILIKITNSTDSYQAEIALMLLTLAGILSNDLLNEPSLMEVTSGMAELSLTEIKPSFEQLAACLTVLQSLVIKSAEILEIVRDNDFGGHAVKFLMVASEKDLAENWIGSVFGILDVLVKSGEECTFEMVTAVVRVLELCFNSSEVVITESEMLSLLNLLVTLTFTPVFAKAFLDQNGLKVLLLAKSHKSDTMNKGIINAWNVLLKQLCEDPCILQASFEVSILTSLNSKVSLENFLKGFKTQNKSLISRSKEIFENALKNVCSVVRKDTVYIEKKKNRGEIVGERWNSISVICECLAEIFNSEQQGKTGFLMTSERLVSILGDLFTAYPRLIGDVLGISVSVYDNISECITTKPFLSHLLRNFVPFRYHLKIEKGKILFFHPGSSTSVTSTVYQNWVKTSVKLLRSLMLKQSYKQPESPFAEQYSQIWLDQNSAVLKSRKKIIRQFREIYSEQLKKNWFDSEKSMALVRTISTIIMQLLREPSKHPFSATGPVEIARSLTCDLTPMPKLLSEAVKGVNLSFPKAGSILSILLAPLELLTKYSLNFVLKIAKPAEFNEAPIEVFHEDEIEEDEEQNEDDDEEVEEEDEEESVHNSGEESAESSEGQEEQPPVDEDIVIESWNTEAIWADDLEEEEEEFPRRNIESRPYDVIMAERALLEQENQPALNYRHIFRDEENAPGGLAWREFENDDIIQILLQRSRNHLRQEPPPEPVFQRIFPDVSEAMQQIAIELSELAIEEPLQENSLDSEEENPVNPVPDAEAAQGLLEMNNESSEIIEEVGSVGNEERPAGRPSIPEGIDPSFLEALPEEIRNEILAQYNPARNEAPNDEFLQALPPEIRNEVMMQQRPPARPAQEMDNATFVASLTPDLRRDVLMGANEEFLSSLPPDLVAEARILQERIHNNRENYLIGRQPQAIKKKSTYEEDKTILAVINDEKLANSLTPADDLLLEVLVKALYLAAPVNREILNSVFLNLSVQSNNRSKIIDAFVCLLLQNEPVNDFPPKQLIGSEAFLENYSKVHAIVSVRIIDILQNLVTSNTKVSFELVGALKHRLGLIKNMRPEESSGFQDLISLMDHSLFRTSTSHLTPLVGLISTISAKLGNKIPALDQIAVNRICSLLSFESLNESTVKTVVEMVTKLSEMESNKEKVGKALKHELRAIGEEVAISLNKRETSVNGLKELQVLRLCKVIIGATGVINEIDFLWAPLTEVLNSITEKETQLASTTNPVLNKLLPLIESFFISHYERASSDTFRSFTEKNCKVINLLIRQNPNLLHDTFNSLVSKFPGLLDFENKRVYFKTKLREIRQDRGHDSIKLHVRRAEVFMDSFHQLKVRTPAEMLGKLRVQFVGEEGLDAGGLTREWYGLLSREMFNPNYALFIPSANGVSFQPNSMSSINPEHIQFFKFVGRIIGKSLCDSYPLDVYFTRSFYKHILNQEVTYQDMEDLDVDFYKSLKALIEINLSESDLHEYYFSYEIEEFGKREVKELIPEGKNIRVTEANKMEYIKLLCHSKMTKNIQTQIDTFKAGFNELVPSELISIFDAKELELLISGLPTIDLEDLKANTDYHNYTVDSPVIVWFWEVLEEFSREERAEFLQFVTGSSKVPLEGFKALPGMGGFQKFQIHKSFASTERLPSAHTCMNQLDLPEYPNKDYLKQRLKFAISEGKEGFGFV